MTLLTRTLNLFDFNVRILAMKFLDFEWKMLNAYHVIVRRKTSDEQLDAVYSNNNYSSIH